MLVVFVYMAVHCTVYTIYFSAEMQFWAQLISVPFLDNEYYPTTATSLSIIP